MNETANVAQQPQYIMCCTGGLAGTILRTKSNMDVDSFRFRTDLLDGWKTFEIIRAGGKLLAEHPRDAISHGFSGGHELSDSSLSASHLKKHSRDMGEMRFACWSKVTFSDFEGYPASLAELLPKIVYSLDHGREITIAEYIKEFPAGHVAGGTLYFPECTYAVKNILFQQNSASVRNEICGPTGSFFVRFGPDFRGIVAQSSIEFKTLDGLIADVFGDGRTDESVRNDIGYVACFQMFMRMSVKNLVRVATAAIVARPAILGIPMTEIIPGGSRESLVPVKIDDFHAYYLSFMVHSYGLTGSYDTRTGVKVYSEAMLMAVRTKIDNRPVHLIAFDVCAITLSWMPSAMQIRRLIESFRYYWDPACMSRPTCESLFEVGMTCVVTERVIRTLPYAAEGTIPIYTFVNDCDLFFYMNGGDPNAFPRYVAACSKARAPWDVKHWTDMADLARGKLLFFKDALRHNPKYFDDRAEIPFPMETILMKSTIGPGWLAAMVSKNRLVANLPERGVTMLIGCLNFTDLYGTPTIMRDAKTGDSDDLSMDEKALGGVELMRLFREDGLRLSNVPKTFKFLEDMYLKDVAGVPTICAMPTKRGANRNLVAKYECPGGYLTRTFPIGSLRPIALNEHTSDCRDRAVRGTGICSNAAQLIEQFIAACPKESMHRFIVELRHFDDNVVISSEPFLHAGSRDVFKLMSFIAYICPELVVRTGLRFEILNGTIYWDLVRKHLVAGIPAHAPWNLYSVGNVIARTEDRVYVASGRVGMIEITEGETFDKISEMYPLPCKFSETCSGCSIQPTLRHFCGSVNRCVGCGFVAVCTECKLPTFANQWSIVKPAPLIRIDLEARKTMLDDRAPLFKWQADAVAKLVSFARPAEVVWLPPGSGKTRIIIDYLIWCNDNNSMTKYVVWVTPTAAIANLVIQLTRANIPFYRHEKSKEEIRPGCVNIIRTDALIRTNREEMFRIAPELTFVLDEFHSCLGGNSQKSEMALALARSALRTISMSGTPYRSQSSIGDLAKFLALCVDFSVTDSNIQVALGLMISHRVPSKSTIRRELVSFQYDATKYEKPGRTNDHAQGLALCDAMIPHIVRSVDEEVGVVVGVADAACADYLQGELGKCCIQSIIQNSRQPFSIDPSVAPDPRGAGIIAKDEWVGNGVSPSDITGSRIGIGGPSPFLTGFPNRLQECTPASVVALSGAYAKGWSGQAIEKLDVALAKGLKLPKGQVVNQSWRLPHVVIVVVKEGHVVGYDMNRYRRMFIPVVPMADSTRGQFEGRIDRANNDSPFIEYVTFYSSIRAHMQRDQEAARNASDALRDISGGSDAMRRITEGVMYNKFEDYYRQATTRRDRYLLEVADPLPTDTPAIVTKREMLEACAFFGITFVSSHAVFKNAYNQIRREILRYLPVEGANLKGASHTFIVSNQAYVANVDMYAARIVDFLKTM